MTSLMPWRTDYLHKFKVPLINDALKKDMETNSLSDETIQKISTFLFDDSLLPQGNYRTDPKFKEPRSESDLLYSSDSNVNYGIDIEEIKQFYQLWNSEVSIAKLLQEMIVYASQKRGNLQPKNLKKMAIMDISQFLLLEQELISNIYRGSQLLMQAKKQILFIKDLSPNCRGLEYNEDLKQLVSSYGTNRLTETSSERFQFNLWIKEIRVEHGTQLSNDYVLIDTTNVEIVNKMNIKKDSMEEFTRSEDPELASHAKQYLLSMGIDAYTYEFHILNNRNICLINTIEESPLWPTICKITPLLGMIVNACFQFGASFEMAKKHEQQWIGHSNIPYSLKDRVLMITILRNLAIIKNAVASNYFTKRQNQIIGALQTQYATLNPGKSLTTLDQLSATVKQSENSGSSNSNWKSTIDLEEFEEKKTEKSSSSKKKKKAQAEHKQVSKSNNNNVPEEPKLEAPLSTIALSDAQTRFKSIWGNQDFSYSPRVQRWVNVANHNQVDAIATFADRGQATYAAIPSEQELRAILELHNCLPIHKIYADRQWRDQFTFPTEWQGQDGTPSKGFGMICRLKINDKLFKGKLYVGFDKDHPNQIIHHCFVLNNRNDATYESFIRAVNTRPTEKTDHFYDIQETNQLLWDDILCELKGIGPRTQSITMKAGNREISVIPHNRS